MSEKDLAVGDVSCLGQCDGAPAMSINDHIYRSVTTAQAEALVLTALGGSELPEMPPIRRKPGGWRPIHIRTREHYGALRKLLGRAIGTA